MPEPTTEERLDIRLDFLERNHGVLVTNANELGQKMDDLANDFTALTLEATKPQHDKLFAALAIAQGAIQTAVAEKENKHFDFKYADLDACWGACRAPLSDNELAIIQLPISEDEKVVTLRTILGHSSGQSISTVMSMTPDKPGPQAIGSCMTYLRRYMLCALVGISQADDDANAASADPDEYERVSKTQIDEILVLANKLFGKNEDAVVDRMLNKVFDVTMVADIPSSLHQEALNLLTNQAKREESAAKKAELAVAFPPDDKPAAGAKPEEKPTRKRKGKDDEDASPDVGDGPDNEVPGT